MFNNVPYVSRQCRVEGLSLDSREYAEKVGGSQNGRVTSALPASTGGSSGSKDAPAPPPVEVPDAPPPVEGKAPEEEEAPPPSETREERASAKLMSEAGRVGHLMTHLP